MFVVIVQEFAKVSAQTRGDFELLVVDDGSTDGTADAVRPLAEDPRVRLVVRGRSDGPAAARNDAIALARGRYVSMLDSDDLWLPPYLEHMAKLDPRVFFALAQAIKDHDASDLLPQIRVPVLVIAGERDFFCPPRVASEMADLIPGAELFVIPGGSHAATIEQPELFDLRLERFLEERVYPRAAG